MFGFCPEATDDRLVEGSAGGGRDAGGAVSGAQMADNVEWRLAETRCADHGVRRQNERGDAGVTPAHDAGALVHHGIGSRRHESAVKPGSDSDHRRRILVEIELATDLSDADALDAVHVALLDYFDAPTRVVSVRAHYTGIP